MLAKSNIYNMLLLVARKTPELTSVEACWTSCAFWIWMLGRGPFDQNQLVSHSISSEFDAINHQSCKIVYLMCNTWWINTSMNSVRMSNVKSLSFFGWVSITNSLVWNLKEIQGHISPVNKQISKFIVSYISKAGRNTWLYRWSSVVFVPGHGEFRGKVIDSKRKIVKSIKRSGTVIDFFTWTWVLHIELPLHYPRLKQPWNRPASLTLPERG